jgi:hypothetical protein
VARRAHGPRPLATALVLLATASAAPTLADAAAAGARAAARTAGRPADAGGADGGQTAASAVQQPIGLPTASLASPGQATHHTLLNREIMSGSRK